MIDKRHDCCGASIKGKAFVFPYGRGSTGTPGIFLEAVRNGCAPAAIVNVKSEPMIIMCALLAEAFFKVVDPDRGGWTSRPRKPSGPATGSGSTVRGADRDFGSRLTGVAATWIHGRRGARPWRRARSC